MAVELKMLFNPFEILVWKMKKEWSRGFAWKEIEQHFTAAADTRTRHTLQILGLKQVIIGKHLKRAAL